MNPRYVNAPEQFVKKTRLGFRREMVTPPEGGEPKMTEIEYGPVMYEVTDGSNASNRMVLSRANALAVYNQLQDLLHVHVAIGILQRVRVGASEFEYLVGKISAPRKHAGCWEFPGGKQEENDATLEDALKREYLEELGIEIRVVREVHQEPYPHDPKFVTLHFFKIETDQEPVCKDHDEIAFKTMDELKEMNTMDAVMKTDFHVLMTVPIPRNGNHN